MPVKWGAASDTGALRLQNEDAFLAEENIFVVADGMGGHNAGEVASAMATTMLGQARKSGIADATQLAKIIEQINHSIYQASADQTDQRGMGTTVTVLAMTTSKDSSELSATVANIGDSRTYLLREGEFRQVTIDHSYVQDLVSQGLITREEARTHARRNIVTRALGIEPTVAVDTWTLPLIDGDRFVLCSDGLVDEVTDEKIKECVAQKIEPQKIADQLVSIANSNGGRDNITVIVVDVVTNKKTQSIISALNPNTSGDKKPLVKKLAMVGAVAIVLVGSIALLSSYLRSGYFVAFENKEPNARVLVYRGKNFLWISPTIEADSTLTRGDLSTGLSKEISARPSFSSSIEARDYVNQVRDVVEQVVP